MQSKEIYAILIGDFNADFLKNESQNCKNHLLTTLVTNIEMTTPHE